MSTYPQTYFCSLTNWVYSILVRIANGLTRTNIFFRHRWKWSAYPFESHKYYSKYRVALLFYSIFGVKLFYKIIPYFLYVFIFFLNEIPFLLMNKYFEKITFQVELFTGMSSLYGITIFTLGLFS